MNYYTYHIGDWRGGTAHLSLEEEATYRRLIDMQYDTENPLLTDCFALARKVRSSEQLVRAMLEEFFVLEDSGWVNVRAMQTIADHKSFIARQRENGQKGGRRKNDKPTGKQSPSTSKPKPKPPISHYPLPIILKNNKKVSDAWASFTDHRRAMKKPVTALAAKEIFKMLESYGPDGAAEALLLSVANGYQGVFPPKHNNRNATNHRADKSSREFAEDILIPVL